MCEKGFLSEFLSCKSCKVKSCVLQDARLLSTIVRITKYAYFGYTYKVIVICYISPEPQFIRCDKDFYSMKWWSKTYGPIFTSYLCSILLKTQKYREKLPANCARKPPIIPSIAVQGEKIIRAPMTREVKYTQLKSVHSYIEHQPWRPFLTTW